MRIKYTIPLVGIICAIFLCITVFIKYNDYLSNSEEEGAVTLILEDLSVNYLNGDKIDLGEDDNEKVIEFSITSHATNEIIYQIDLTDISGNFESATYSIEKSNGSDFSIGIESITTKQVNDHLALDSLVLAETSDDKFQIINILFYSLCLLCHIQEIFAYLSLLKFSLSFPPEIS